MKKKLRMQIWIPLLYLGGGRYSGDHHRLYYYIVELIWIKVLYAEKDLSFGRFIRIKLIIIVT
jgi:hypothetical protein